MKGIGTVWRNNEPCVSLPFRVDKMRMPVLAKDPSYGQMPKNESIEGNL